MSHAQIAEILDTVLATWTEDCYTVGAYARNSSGLNCQPESAHAVCWCLYGAVQAALRYAPQGLRGVVWRHLFASVDALYTDAPRKMSVIDVSDDCGYAAARAVLEHARARLDMAP